MLVVLYCERFDAYQSNNKAEVILRTYYVDRVKLNYFLTEMPNQDYYTSCISTVFWEICLQVKSA